MLTRQKKLFCDLYLSNGFNATKAAIDAKYNGKKTTLRTTGNRLKNDPECKAYIEANIKEIERNLNISKEDVFKILSEKIRGMTTEETVLVTREGSGKEYSDTIERVEVRIKHRDILKSIELYAKLRGWFKDEADEKPNVTINNNIPKGVVKDVKEDSKKYIEKSTKEKQLPS